MLLMAEIVGVFQGISFTEYSVIEILNGLCELFRGRHDNTTCHIFKQRLNAKYTLISFRVPASSFIHSLMKKIRWPCSP